TCDWSSDVCSSDLAAEGCEAEGFGFHFRGSEGTRGAKPDDGGDIEGAGAHAAFVAASVHLLSDGDTRRATADIQRADAFGPVELVGGNREQVDVVAVDVDG